jgi:serine/threonine protein kinase
MALKVHNRIRETNSDSMIDAQVNPSKPSPNTATLVSSSPSDEREISQCKHDENTPRTDICTDACSDSSDIEWKYHIDSNILGEGHHGSVRKCINRSTGKRHAVKSINKSAPSVNIKGIQREVSLLESLKHERILQLDDVLEDSQYVHLVTELCTGGELFDKIVEKSSNAPGCFSEAEAARILHQLLDAVSYLHKNSVVHRDIKPENIMFETCNEDSDIKLIDFGLARKHSRGAPMSTIVGTPYYLAPEGKFLLLLHANRVISRWLTIFFI